MKWRFFANYARCFITLKWRCQRVHSTASPQIASVRPSPVASGPLAPTIRRDVVNECRHSTIGVDGYVLENVHLEVGC